MAPIYLAQKSTAPINGINLFKSKGIHGHIPSTISSLAVFGVPHEHQVAYGLYTSSLCSFIYATSAQKTVTTNAAGFPDFVARKPFDFELPTVAFIPRVQLKPDQESGFLTKLGAGASRELIGKKTVFRVIKPSDKLLASLVRGCDPDFQSGPDSVTPIGYLAGQFIIHAISEFLATHTYAAFNEPEQSKDGPVELSTLSMSKERVPGNVSAITNGEVLTVSSCIPSVQDVEPYVVPEGGSDEDKEAAYAKWRGTANKKLVSVYIKNVAGTIAKAKPSPFHTSYNVGPLSAIPEVGGLCFPYFEGMNTPDPVFLKVTVGNLFLRLMGGNKTSQEEHYQEYRRGMNSLATTKQGRVIVHMLAGIKMALETQTRLFVVMEPEYVGFVLLGSRFSVFHGGKFAHALNSTDLRADFAMFSPHNAAVKNLAIVLEDMRANFMPDVEDMIQVEDVDTVPKLVAMLKRVEIGDDGDNDTIAKLNRALRALSFSPHYFTVNPQSLELFLKNLINDEYSVPPSLPIHFPDFSLDYEDKLTRLLLAYGPEAPSPINSKGNEVLLEASEVIEDKGGKRAKSGKFDLYGNMPKELIFAPKPAVIAVKDWKRALITDGVVKMDEKERARGYRAMVVKDDDSRKTLWKCMVDAKEKLAKKEEVHKEKKRKNVPGSC